MEPLRYQDGSEKPDFFPKNDALIRQNMQQKDPKAYLV